VLREPSIRCIRNIQSIMINLIDLILNRDRFSRFPKLCAKIKDIIIGHIINNRYESTNDKVNDFLIEETESVWTDDTKFRDEILPNIFSKSVKYDISSQTDIRRDRELTPRTPLVATRGVLGSSIPGSIPGSVPGSVSGSVSGSASGSRNEIKPDIIRTVLSAYFDIVKNVANHSIRKKINTFFVNRIVDDINTKLTDHILLKSDINQMLEENKEKAVKREGLLKMKEKIELARLLIGNIY
jgi:hypothetical protein